ncbi:MAG: response regulator, partial [Lachnospiraceae bacterium]|nr:response regulator [Lachnospiraceae bacterium]
MYKVAIIDDEPIIVEGLSKTIDWSKWNARVAGFAYDGAEGIELIRKEKPDILISDIAMPNMDGLTMIAAVKSEFPYMQVSVLTGYREFDYAREALHLGVTRFLLKPSRHDEIEEAITAMTDKLRQSGRTGQEQE